MTSQTPREERQLGRNVATLARQTRSSAIRDVFSLLDAPSRPAVGERDRLYRRALAFADGFAACLALVLSVMVLGEDDLRPTSLLAVPIVIAVSKLIGLYDRNELLLRRSALDESPALFQLAILYALLTWLLGPLIVDGELGRTQVFGLWVMLLGSALLCRAAARWLVRHMAPPERCLVVGDAHARDRVAGKLDGGGGIKAELVAWVPLDRGHDLASGVRQIRDTIARNDIHRVIVAPRMADTDATLDVICLVKGTGVKVSVLPRLFEVVGSSVEFDDLNGVTVLGVRRFGLTRSSFLVKRAMDVVGAALGLIAAGLLMALIAVAIRLDSRRPVLFRQARVGRDGRQFEMLKFRTMVEGADAMKAELRALNETSGLFKVANDPRITRVGRLLRGTSLDELPQLVNVLRGEMSLVGPRPLVLEEDCKVEGWHRRRLHLTPGMTGQWQILGSARIPLHEMVKIDYLYVANWSFWGDVKILLRTIPCVLRRSGL